MIVNRRPLAALPTNTNHFVPLGILDKDATVVRIIELACWGEVRSCDVQLLQQLSQCRQIGRLRQGVEILKQGLQFGQCGLERLWLGGPVHCRVPGGGQILVTSLDDTLTFGHGKRCPSERENLSLQS